MIFRAHNILHSGIITILLIPLLFISCSEEKLCIPYDELENIGRLIFQNEGAGKIENLTVWNEGEEFASLGIGHFLWFPEGKEYRFNESFPDLLIFLESEGADIPPWIREMPDPDLPWNTREEFYENIDSKKMVSLRDFLVDTAPLQTLFIANRLERGLPEILSSAPEKQREHIKTQFYRVANSPMGMYVLIDYVNFKGEGIKESERYNGQGWGLLQVLSGMSGTEPGYSALLEFSQSAQSVLKRRVDNSPPERNEKRWLPGWNNRIQTYRKIEYKTLERKSGNSCNESGWSMRKVSDFLKYLLSGSSAES